MLLFSEVGYILYLNCVELVILCVENLRNLEVYESKVKYTLLDLTANFSLRLKRSLFENI